MVGGIVSGLIVAAVIGVLAIMRKRIRRAWRRRNPVSVSVTRLMDEPWGVALQGELLDARQFVESAPTNLEVHQWLLRQGAVSYPATKLRLTLRNRTDELVVVRNMRLDLERSQPLSGTSVICPIGGVNADVVLRFNLDQELPVAWQWAEDRWQPVGSAPFFEGHNVTLREEPQDFTIICEAEHCSARWRLLVDIEIGTSTKVLTVGDGDDAFATSGEPADGFSANLSWAYWEGGRFIPRPPWEDT
jgi:hypothetical protein